MPKLIKPTQVIADDSWRLLDAAVAIADIPAAGDVIVPLALWGAQRDALAARDGRTGVWLASGEGPEALAADVDRLPLIAVHFAKFSDGRGFSTAQLLRERYHFRGELRAIGDVLRDQLLFMHRCGFDTYALRDDQDVESALAAFGDFTDAYQASVTEPAPLFRRRLATPKAK